MEPTPPGPTPIPVEGDVQVFADPECTRYPSGEVDTIYVRINVPWVGLDSGWEVGDTGDSSTYFLAISPYSDAPDDPYTFMCWVDYFALEDGPYVAGQIVEAKASEAYDVTDFQKVFTRP